MLLHMACTAIKGFQGLILHSFETHLNTDKANLTSLKKKKNQQTNKKNPHQQQKKRATKHPKTQPTKTKQQGGRMGEEQEVGERACNCNIEHYRNSARFILDCIHRLEKQLKSTVKGK